MSDFKVFTDSEGSYDNYSGESRYHFNDAGLLVTVKEDGERRIYSPTGWVRLDDTKQESHPKAYVL